MYRLLIVDNERIVVDSLICFFEKRQPENLEVVGAYSGHEAMEIMNRTKVDILLTDIRMPGIDGLQLQREASQHWPWCRTILLSGFNEFNYIQEAMRNHAVDYLLKTEGNEAVLAAVLRTMESLDNQLRTEELIQQAKAQYAKALPLLKHKLLSNLIIGQNDALNNMADRFRQLNISLSTEYVWPVFLRLKDNPSTMDADLLAVSIEAIARDIMGRGVSIEQLVMSSESLIWMINLPKTWELQRRQSYLKGSIENIQQQCSIKLSVHLSACMSCDEVKWRLLPQKMEKLRYLLNRGLYSKPDGSVECDLLLTDNVPDSSNAWINGELRIYLDQLSLLEMYLDSGNQFAYMETYAGILEAIDNAPRELESDLHMEVFYSLVGLLLKEMNRWQLHEAISKEFNLANLQMRDGWLKTTENLKSFSEAVFSAKQRVSTDANNDLIRRVRWTVENNLGGDLSLSRLADMQGICVNHLSRMYKSYTGESLKGYINRMRMDRAKKLLGNRELRNREVGQAVGYCTEQSFNRFFTSMCGLTPQEYRTQQGK